MLCVRCYFARADGSLHEQHAPSSSSRVLWRPQDKDAGRCGINVLRNAGGNAVGATHFEIAMTIVGCVGFCFARADGSMHEQHVPSSPSRVRLRPLDEEQSWPTEINVSNTMSLF